MQEVFRKLVYYVANRKWLRRLILAILSPLFLCVIWYHLVVSFYKGFLRCYDCFRDEYVREFETLIEIWNFEESNWKIPLKYNYSKSRSDYR